MSTDRGSTRSYLIVWGWLMGLALASVLLSFLHLGAWAPAVALGIGLVKATLIAAFFMRLVDQPPVCRWAFALGIGLAVLLLLMVGADVLTRDDPGVRQPGLSSAVPSPAPALLDVSGSPGDAAVRHKKGRSDRRSSGGPGVR